MVIHERKDGAQLLIELFDLIADRADGNNLAEREPETVTAMQTDLGQWQDSVLRSLSGAVYEQ